MIKALMNIFSLTAVLLLSMMPPSASFGAGVEKIRHAASVYADAQGNPLKQPEGVACTDSSLFIVADTGHRRLLQFSYEEGAVKNGPEFKVPQLAYPVRVHINSKGEIYALDGKHNRIVRLGPDGGFRDYIDPKGLPAQSAFVPKSFDIDRNDNLYVLDIFSGRVLVLNPDGEYLKEIEFPAGHGFFSDIAVDFKGSVFLLDGVNAMVFTAADDSSAFVPLTESLKGYMRYPTHITTGVRGRIYLVDKNGSQIVLLGQDGSYLGKHSGMGWKEGLLNYPSQMCINRSGEVYIADTLNHRVQVFTLVR